MKARESLNMQGRVTIRLFDREGRLARYLEADNDIVIAGRDLVAGLLIGKADATLKYLAVGSGGDGIAKPKPEEVELMAQVGVRKEIVIEGPTPTADNRVKLLISAEFAHDEANGDLTEAALFTAKEDGVMYNRVVFPAIKKTNGFKLSLIWEIIF